MRRRGSDKMLQVDGNCNDHVQDVRSHFANVSPQTVDGRHQRRHGRVGDGREESVVLRFVDGGGDLQNNSINAIHNKTKNSRLDNPAFAGKLHFAALSILVAAAEVKAAGAAPASKVRLQEVRVNPTHERKVKWHESEDERHDTDAELILQGARVVAAFDGRSSARVGLAVVNRGQRHDRGAARCLDDEEQNRELDFSLGTVDRVRNFGAHSGVLGKLVFHPRIHGSSRNVEQALRGVAIGDDDRVHDEKKN